MKNLIIKSYFTIVLIIIILLVLNNKVLAHNIKLMMAGSTSVQPIAEKLAEEFMKENHNIKIEVQGGGSSAGIQVVQNGACDIGMSSRELKPNEKNLHEFILAYDAIILIVNNKNSVSNISTSDIKKIFSLEKKFWYEIENSNNKGRITVLTREDGSGTRAAFCELAMGTTEISDYALVCDSTGAIREIVANDEDAIGYISYGSLDNRVKALAIDGILPNLENFMTNDKTKRYKLMRPFLLLTKSKPNDATLEFMKFIRSQKGTEIIKKEGLIPINDTSNF